MISSVESIIATARSDSITYTAHSVLASVSSSYVTEPHQSQTHHPQIRPKSVSYDCFQVDRVYDDEDAPHTIERCWTGLPCRAS